MKIHRMGPEDDLRAVADIYARSWKAAYRGIVSDAYLHTLTGERWEKAFRKGRLPAYVMVDEGRYLGVVAFCAGRDEGTEGWGEIASLYLLPEFWGKGLGTTLLDVARNELGEMGFRQHYLWVFQENCRGRRFYERHGFHPSGVCQTLEISGQSVMETRYDFYTK